MTCVFESDLPHSDSNQFNRQFGSPFQMCSNRYFSLRAKFQTWKFMNLKIKNMSIPYFWICRLHWMILKFPSWRWICKTNRIKTMMIQYMIRIQYFKTSAQHCPKIWTIRTNPKEGFWWNLKNIIKWRKYDVQRTPPFSSQIDLRQNQ